MRPFPVALDKEGARSPTRNDISLQFCPNFRRLGLAGDAGFLVLEIVPAGSYLNVLDGNRVPRGTLGGVVGDLQRVSWDAFRSSHK